MNEYIYYCCYCFYSENNMAKKIRKTTMRQTNKHKGLILMHTHVRKFRHYNKNIIMTLKS